MLKNNHPRRDFQMRFTVTQHERAIIVKNAKKMGVVSLNEFIVRRLLAPHKPDPAVRGFYATGKLIK